MPDEISLHPATSHAVSIAGAASGPRSKLPVDLLQDISRRLAFISLAIVVIVIAGVVVAEATRTVTNRPMQYTMAVLAVVASLIVFYLARSDRIGPTRLLDLGSGYEVLVALVASQNIVTEMGVRPALTWSGVAVWVLIYPVIVPNTMGRTAVASVLAAATEPLMVMAYAAAGSITMPAFGVFARSMWPNVVAVLLALAVSRTMYQLGQKLTKARALGSYHLEEELGAGGMGEVWKAKHRLLARTAAVKLIQPEVLGSTSDRGTEVILKRFEREAQATAALRSPHTIELYDFGVSRDGALYYVMELLDGLDLYSLVNRYGRQPAGRIAMLLRQACHSLHEAHLHGLIHRDIKPANIFVCRYGADLDFVKVLDFGLVKRGDAQPKKHDQLTQAGAVSGTPAFMSPEQAMGDDEVVDGRSDIYGLGCVGYWLLTGELVFPRSNPMAMVIAHATEEAPPPSSRVGGEIPQKLEDIVMACLRKNPDARPQNARALGKMLEAVEAGDPWTDEMAEAWWEHHSKS
jgi:serine/threonine-protein kinase